MLSVSQGQPRDFSTIDERRSIREAALQYGSVAHYDELRNIWVTEDLNRLL